ncbi:MAG: hypothetical protein VX641_05525 [Planctomycetota bacterium]|nr:hypothetical protein [Planctomycetota bacterium]
MMFPDPQNERLGESNPEESGSPMDFSSDETLGFSAGSGATRRMDRNGMVLVIILLAAIAGLWSMRTLRNGSADIALDSTLPDRIDVEPFDAEIMRRLAIPDPGVIQLVADRDPFQSWRPLPLTDENVLFEALVDNVEPDRQELCNGWQVEVDRVAGLLRLKSVLGGGTERALVNIEGVLLAIGDTFDIAKTDIEFSVEDTDRRSVLLGCYNADLDCWHEVEVTMGNAE